MFMSSMVAKWMTWHKDGRSLQENGEMRHPADSEAWTHFDKVVRGYGVGQQGPGFVTKLGIVCRLHCKVWQKNLSKLPEDTKNAIFRELEMSYRLERTPQLDKEILRHMTTMHKGWRGILKAKHYKGKSFEDAVASIPAGVNPADWRTMCEKWNTREEEVVAERNRQNRAHQSMTYRRGRTSIYQLKDDFVKTARREPDRMEIFKMGRCKDLPDGTEHWVDDESNARYERMTQMVTPDLQSDATGPVSAEEAFVAVMGRDRPGCVRCAGKGETLSSWYGTRAGSSSQGHHAQVQQAQQQVQEQLLKQIHDQNKKMEEICAERTKDREEIERMRNQVAMLLDHMQQQQQMAGQPSKAPPSEHPGNEESESGDDYDE